MGKHDISKHICDLDDFAGWVFIETITREAQKNLGNGGKIFEQFPGLKEASENGEVEICLTIEGIEVDFNEVMKQVYKQYRHAVAEDSRKLAKALVSDEIGKKIDLIKEMLDEVEDQVANEIPEEELERIREWHEEED